MNAMLDTTPAGDMETLESARGAPETQGLPETDAQAQTETSTDAVETADEAKQSQASKLVAFVREHGKLFHDTNRDCYFTETKTDETRRLDSRAFRDWLAASFYEATERAGRDQSIREALSTLAGLARFGRDCREVHLRVAQHDGAYWLDLAEPGRSRAVRIEPGRWEIVDNPPVRFLRPETTRALPEPQRGGTLAPLWNIANVPADAQLLVLAWLMECLRPETPFPLLELIGEQGCAKSTTQAALRRLIDPNACDLRGAPKSAEDVFVTAAASWLTSYENVTHLPAPMQDALCILATGGGFAKRKLYSDAEESVITVKRPIVLNGISASVTAQDLIDRAVSVELPAVAQRVEVTTLWAAFDAEHGRLLGALLDAFAAALARLPHVELPAADRPRLAEFARLGMAVAEVKGQSGAVFLKQFTAARIESIARTIDASPVATAVRDWIEHNPVERTDTAQNLMRLLESYRPARGEGWPLSPKGFADALRRAAPALRQVGVDCRRAPKTGGIIRWTIARRKSPDPCLASPACPGADATDDPKQDMQDMQDIAPAPIPQAVGFDGDPGTEL